MFIVVMHLALQAVSSDNVPYRMKAKLRSTRQRDECLETFWTISELISQNYQCISYQSKFSGLQATW